jgi:molecular chaperone GrpE
VTILKIEGESESEGAAGLGEELDAERKKNQELLTRLKYMQADLENYRKRVDREMREAGESSLRSLVSRLLVVQDELELAAKHAGGKGPDRDLMEGIKMVQGNLEGALESVGVQRIECLGEPFDPALHEAVEKVQGESDEGDVVVEEMRPGFTFRGQLLRPSMVKVELARREPDKEAKASE